MRPALPTALGRVVALALLAAVGAAAYGFVAGPLAARYQHDRQSSAQSSELLVKYRRIGAAADGLRAELAELRRRQAAQGGYLEGASSALAAAGLQNHVKAIVRSTGGELRSTQILPIQDEGEFVRIAIRVQMPVRIEPLQQILYNLERGKPFVFIDNIDIRRRKTRRRKIEPETDIELDVRFDAYGYLRAEAG